MAVPTRGRLQRKAPLAAAVVSTGQTQEPARLAYSQPSTPARRTSLSMQHQPSSTSRLRERRMQLGRQRRSGNPAPAQPRTATHDHAQFSFAPHQPPVSALLAQAPGTGRGAPFRCDSGASVHPAGASWARAAAPAHPPVRSPVRSPGPGTLVPDPLMPIEECSERIERLLQRVQQTHRKYAVQQALAAPQPATRFAARLPQPLPPAASAAGRQSSGSTASTASQHSVSSLQNSTGRHIAAAPYSPRRRAVTLGPSTTKSSGERLALALDQPSAKTPIEEMRAKIERVRARRAARLKEEMAHQSPRVGCSPAAGDRPAMLARMHSEISGTTYYASDDDGGYGEDFFENKENLALFREAQMPVRDIDWDKRVYYHHVARTDDAFREAAEDTNIADCRETCFAELVGRKAAARILRAPRRRTPPTEPRRLPALGLSRSAARLSDAEVDAISAWIDEDSDGSSGDADRSFDWSRHGFGYMEFRRRSRSSLASSSILSPGGPAEPPPPPLPRLPRQDESLEPSASLMAGARSGQAWSITSSTARAATENFNQAVADVAGALPLASEERFCALEDSLPSDSDDDWQLLDSDDVGGRPGDANARAATHLASLRLENDELQRTVEHTRRAVAALMRVVLSPP